MSRVAFSVPSVGAFARSVLRALIDPKLLAVSLWKHIFILVTPGSIRLVT